MHSFFPKPTQAEANVKMPSRLTNATRGLHPMRFPKDEQIPVTEQELHAQGVKYCFHKILAQNQCLAKAKVRICSKIWFR